MDIDGKTAVLKPEHSIKYLSERQNGADFAKLFDDTLTDIAACNADLFSVKTEGGAKIVLFERISQYITDEGRRDDFCRALISKLAGFSFEAIFAQKFDFFATILKTTTVIPAANMPNTTRRTRLRGLWRIFWCRRRCAGKSAAWTFTTRRPVRERC